MAPPRVGAVRVGRGERLGGGRGRGAVTSDGAARSSNAPFVCAAIVLSRPPRPRYPQERKILSLMILIPSVPIRGPYFGIMYGPLPPCMDLSCCQLACREGVDGAREVCCYERLGPRPPPMDRRRAVCFSPRGCAN